MTRYSHIRNGSFCRLIKAVAFAVGGRQKDNARDNGEWLSTGHTQCTLRRMFPRIGEDFYLPQSAEMLLGAFRR